MAKNRSQAYKDAVKLVDPNKSYSLEEAIALAQQSSYSKYVGSLELTIELGIDPAKMPIRGAVTLPNGLGKDVKVAVIAGSDKLEEAKAAGAQFVGQEDLIDEIKGGFLGFDTLIATPDQMGEIKKHLGRLLGPKKLLPNPKKGTVTEDVTKAINEAKLGKVEYKPSVNKSVPVSYYQVPAGKLSFEVSALAENVMAVISEIKRVKPSAAKGLYLRSLMVAPSLGPAINVNIDEL